MGLLDSMIGALAGGQGGGQQQGGGLGGLLGGGTQAAVLSAVIGMLANGQHAQGGGIGGLGDLIGRFTQGGMGDVIGSWVGKGQNAPISGDQLSSVLGSDAIGKIAAQLGLSPAEAADQVAQVLPEAVDRLTPNGQAPDSGLGDFDSLLAQLTKR